MENNKPSAHLDDALVAEAQSKKTRKILIISSAVIGALVLIIAFVLFIRNSKITASEDAISEADRMLFIEQNDSLAMAEYAKVAEMGNYQPNERARVMVAINKYQDGKYEEALKLLDDSSLDSDVLEPGVEALKGDCYVNLGKDNYDKALKCYAKAISIADDNKIIVPFILQKEANVYRAQGDFKKEFEAYSEIYKNYPDFRRGDIQKLMERARLQAEAGK